VSAAARQDAAARRRAQTVFDVPLLLEAGAGTGKTAVLVARIVAWCLGPGWERAGEAGGSDEARRAGRVLRGVVAITFTEAATAEMAHRIALAFEQIRRGELPVGVLPEALPPSPLREVRAAAFRLALDQLRVHTIHAFCLRLLLAHPLAAGVHPRLAVDADGQHVAEAIREVLEEELPRAFGASPDERWLALADAGIGPRDLEAALAALLGEGVAPADLADSGATERRARELVVELERALAGFLAVEDGRLAGLASTPKLSAAARALAEARAVVAGAAGLEPLAAALAALPGWDGVLEVLAELASGRLGVRAREAIGSRAGALSERAAALRPLLVHLERIDPERFATARSVLGELAAGVDLRLRRRGIATFGALLRFAAELLRDPDVRRSLRSELQQLLVDEFQDTDELQCEILRALALDAPEEPHPVLFLVGDPKQSIYGWRNADLRAYQRVRDRVAAAGGVGELVVNFRSAPPILAEVARVVAPVMEAVHGLQPPFQPLEASERTRGLAGHTAGGRAPVEYWLPAKLPAEGGEPESDATTELRAEREARAVAADVAALRDEGVALDEVAILLRVTAAFEPVLEALREAGIPYVVERETDFYQRREIVDAVALVRAVLDPNDHLALVAALRSSLVGVPDAAWLPLWREQLPERAGAIDGRDAARLADARAAAARAAAHLPADVPEAHDVAGWPEALADFLSALHELRAAFERDTAERFVERLRERLLFEASEAMRHLGEHRARNLDRFFRDLVLALDAASGSAASLVAFLRRAGSVPREHQEGRPRAASGDAVHVLTIHRAKGLDWQHVYLLGTDRGQRGDDPKRTAVVRRGRDVGLVLFGWPEPGLPVLASERADVEAAERVRLLYVATTRAKERLVIGARRAEAKPWRRARSFAELLAARDGAPPDWALAAGAPAGVRSADGVRFRVADGADAGGGRAARTVPGRAARTVPGQATGTERALADAAEVARDEERLRALRAAAAVRAARPFGATASAEGEAREERAEAAAGEDAPEARAPTLAVAVASAGDGVPRSVARAAGSVVHALLEAGALGADASLERAVASAARPGERAAVLAHARAVWQRFAAGPLAPRLAALAPHVLARELPVWGEPAADGPGDPVGFVAGAIDLLYRDPVTGELVVADYKTDALAPADLDAAASRYAAQGAHYVRAVARALGLAAPPRFELWFLAAGEVRTVRP